MVMRYVFVPAAWPLTVAAAWLGISPNGATLFHAALSTGGLAMMLSESSAYFAIGLSLFILAKICDSVDGNLARLQDRASYFGKYLDGLVDIVEDLAFPLVLGLHLLHLGAPAQDTLIPAGLAVLALAIAVIAIYRLPLFELILEKDRGTEESVRSHTDHPRFKAFLASRFGRFLLYCDAHGMNATFDARYLGLACALVAGSLSWYLEFLAALYAVTAILIVSVRVIRGYVTLDVHRRSRSAA